MAQKRTLAAIMFTDLVDFSSLTNTNEAKALQLIEVNRQHQKPIIKKYGMFIKEMGDGMLAKFKSAADSIACAWEIQETAPSMLKDKIRIGIHLGDITEENGDVFGDGVNIASRIESIAEPGSIYISDPLYTTIKSREDISCESVGEKELKNISDPIKCFKVIDVNDSLLKGEKKGLSTTLALSLFTVFISLFTVFYLTNKKDKAAPVLLVMPFEQIEGDSSDQYLKLGIADEIISFLGKNEKLEVINTQTTRKFLASFDPFSSDVNSINNADYFVSGEYAKNGNIVQLNVRMEDRDQNEIWSNNYSNDIVFLPQTLGNVSIDVSSAIDQDMSQEDVQLLSEIKSVDPETYGLYLKGMTIINKYDVLNFQTGIPYLEQAVEKSPDDARAWAGLAEGYVWLGHRPGSPPGAWNKAKAAAIRAIQLDSTNAEAWAALAHAKTYFEYDYEGARKGYEKANKLNPNMAFNHYHYAWHLYLLDSIDKAIEEHKIAQKLDPFAPVHTYWLGALLLWRNNEGDLAAGKQEIIKSLKIDSSSLFVWSHLALAYQMEGKKDSAEYAMQMELKFNPMNRYTSYYEYCMRYGRTGEGYEILKEIDQLPLNSFTALIKANGYLEVDSADKYFEYMAFKPRDAFGPWWVRKKGSSEVIVNDPRYPALLEEFNLPPPVSFDNNF